MRRAPQFSNFKPTKINSQKKKESLQHGTWRLENPVSYRSIVHYADYIPALAINYYIILKKNKKSIFFFLVFFFFSLIHSSLKGNPLQVESTASNRSLEIASSVNMQTNESETLLKLSRTFPTYY